MGQFRALMTKNWILYKRSWVGSIFEIIVPLIVVCFIVAVRKIATVTDNPQTSYLSTARTFPSNNSLLANYLKSCTANMVSGQLSRNGIVALSPSTDPIISQLGTKLTSLGYTVQYFPSDTEIDALARSQYYQTNSSYPGICFGVTMVTNNNHQYIYNLRYNISTSSSEGPDTKARPTLITPFSNNVMTNPTRSGMLAINNVMLNYIMRNELGDNDYNAGVTIAPMTQQAYVTDNIYTYLGNSIDFMLLIPLLIVYLRQTGAMLEEKEKKIRETMKIMGMSNFNYYMTWFIRYFCVYVVIHALATVILHFSLGIVNPGLVFISFILFDILLIVQSFFIQVFFSRSKIGIVIALIFFILQYVLNFIVRTSTQPTIRDNTLAAISAHSAYVLFFQQYLYAVSNQYKLGFSDVTTNINQYTTVTSWISFIINIVVWLLLTLYLDQVFPNEWGAKKSPLFCFQCPNKIQEQDSVMSKQTLVQQNVEEVEERFKEKQYNGNSIKIKNLVKEFDNGRKAVDNLNLKMYSDQIFVLLGHNGAGKTTTISMLTGILEPTSGSIQEIGFDSRKEMDQIRNNMGLCPQHDTLYQQLTVSQHLYLFGTFKGYDSDLLDQQVDKLIKSVNLQQKTDYISKDLSGGQKRRLSVAMAFVGGSKLIFLDEPTSGMDTTARRFVWDMMKDYKSDRIIILTTHFMDEADFLGDRIAIMSDGKLICCGSTIFLKNKYGVGYNLTFSKLNTNVSSMPIINVVTKHIQSAQITTDVSTEVSFQLPMEEVSKFPKMFEEIDANKDRLSYQSYGVSITTLEEVFLKVAESRVQEDPQDAKQVELMDGNLIPETVDSDYNDIKPEQGTRFWRHIQALWIKRFWMTVKDYKTVAYQFIYPIVIILVALFLMRISWIADRPAQAMEWSLFAGEGKLHIPIAGNDTFLNTTLKDQLNTDFGNYLDVTEYASPDAADFDINVLFPRKSRALKGGIYIGPSTNSTSFNYYTLVNTQSPLTPFLFSTSMTQSIINTRKSPSAPPVKIKVVNAPLPISYSQSSLNNTISGFLASFIFSLALSFKFSAVAAFLVKQRQDRCKYQQIVSGMNIYAYWIGNFLFDFSMYFIVGAFAAAMCSAFKVQSLTSGDALGATWSIIILYGLANLPLTYMAAFLFKDYSNAQAGVYFFNFISGGVISTLALVLRMIGDTGGVVIRALCWVLRLFPAFSFGQALVNQGSTVLLAYSENGGVPYKVWDMLIVLAPVIYMAAQFIIYFLILFLIEYLSNSESFMRFFSQQKSIPYLQQQEQDNDVIFEANKAMNADPNDYAILTKGLRKVYMLPGDKHKVAVDNMSFGVEKGEVFGLLGVNGAGKTTTFKMLAGQVTSTDGDSYLNGMKISENLSTVRTNLGYCPQFDALFQNLTVTQQLNLYYDLKMLPSDLKQKVVQSKIRQLNLQKYKNIQSGTLSGGNKRKLSVACAMIGNPAVLFLDEPSTGMDPQARRFMWRVISQVATQKKQSTVILTTHSMEQAEALSSRLGIMVKGNFKCIGTTQHLKSKFGQGYELEVKLLIPTKQQINQKLQSVGFLQHDKISSLNLEFCIDRLTKNEQLKKQVSDKGSGKFLLTIMKQSGSIRTSILAQYFLIEERGLLLQQFIKNKFEKPEIIEHFEGFYRFRLKSKTPIGKIFGEFQNNKDKLFIQQYSIKQATVEQIFNKFAAQYEYNEED